MVVDRTVEERAAIRLLAQRELARVSFPDFLRFCRIRSDDPQAPGLITLSPWPFQVERAEAWAAGASEVILKERQLGFSAVLVAPYMLWRAMYHGWACGYLSVGQAEAREEIQRVARLYANLPAHLQVDGRIRADDAEFDGGGRIIAFPSTEHAGISYTLQLVVMDEAAFHPYGSANYAAIHPAAALGQFLILSTADPNLGPLGFFHDMYWASRRGETPYAAVFEARRRPDRDAAWYMRERSAYVGRLAEFEAYYPETDAEAFKGRTGRAFPEFTREVHVVTPFTIPDSWTRWKSTDYGYVDPFCTLWFARSPDRQRVVTYREVYETGLTASAQARRVKAMSEGESYALHVADPSMWGQRERLSTLSMADESGMEGVALSAANNDRLAGWAKVHEALSWTVLAARQTTPRWTIFETCKDLIRELGTLPVHKNRPEDVGGEGASDHAADAARYGLMVEGQRGRPEDDAGETVRERLERQYGIMAAPAAGSTAKRIAG